MKTTTPREVMNEPGEAPRTIYFTNNYGLFSWIPGNRELDPRRINKIVQANNAGINLFPYVPILVTKKHKIVDGQHRLMAAKKLKTLIFFMYIDDCDVKQIARINSVTKSWAIKDYLNCWINLGKEDYLELEKFVQDYNIPLSSAASLLMLGYFGKGGKGSVGDSFKDGTFEIKHRDFALKIGEMYKDYIEISDFKKSAALIRAVCMLDTSDKYEHDEVVQKITTTGGQLMMKESPMEFISHIELLYNKGNHNRKVIY